MVLRVLYILRNTNFFFKTAVSTEYQLSVCFKMSKMSFKSDTSVEIQFLVHGSTKTLSTVHNVHSCIYLCAKSFLKYPCQFKNKNIPSQIATQKLTLFSKNQLTFSMHVYFIVIFTRIFHH